MFASGYVDLKMKVMVTGAGGFIGKHLCLALADAGFDVVPVLQTARQDGKDVSSRSAVFKNIDGSTSWKTDLTGVNAVVHLAARVHVNRSGGEQELASFRRTNVDGTRNLARQCLDSGVDRFVYLSTIKVNGEETGMSPFHRDQKPNPMDSYALSKKEAEDVLSELSTSGTMGVVIVRPPLVYGPGIKGNLATLASVIRAGAPLPFGAVQNNRDLVSLYNLCDLIRVCIVHPDAPGNTFLVSDNESISTVELITYMADGLNRKARLPAVPLRLLEVCANIFGMHNALRKLTGDLQLDISETLEILNWNPPLTVAESFKKMYAKV